MNTEYEQRRVNEIRQRVAAPEVYARIERRAAAMAASKPPGRACCGCGCGGIPKGGEFMTGHNARAMDNARRRLDRMRQDDPKTVHMIRVGKLVMRSTDNDDIYWLNRDLMFHSDQVYTVLNEKESREDDNRRRIIAMLQAEWIR